MTTTAERQRPHQKLATRARLAQWTPAALILAGLALLVLFTVREVLDPVNTRLPGRDASNVYLWEYYNRVALDAGRLPHWNPYHFAGTPHLADNLTALFYPPAVLLRWLPLPLFFGWLIALHLWLAGAGTLYLGRLLRLSWPAAAAAAVAVTLGGSVGGWLYNGHILLINGSAWLPLALALAIQSVRRRRVIPHPVLVLVLVLQFLAGYLQGSLYVVGAVSLYFVYSALWPEEGAGRAQRLMPLAQLAVLGALTAGLVAIQLAPTVRLVQEAGRTAGLPYNVAAEGGWGIGDLATVFLPFRGISDAIPHRFTGDRSIYVGWMLACLVPFAFFDRSRRRVSIFLAALAGTAIALTLADALPFYRLHHAIFPGLRVPGRVLFLATASMAILGAIGLERFVELSRTRARSWGLHETSAAAAVIAAVALAMIPADGPSRPAHLWPWLPLIAAAGLASVLSLASRAAVHAALVVACLVVVVDITAFSAGALHSEPMESREELRAWLGAPDPGRAISICENRLGAGGMLLNGQVSLDGLAGVHLAAYADWAYITQTGDAPPSDGMYHRIGRESVFPERRDLLNMANVTTIYSCRPLDMPALRMVSHVGPIYTYRNLSAWPRAVWTCGAEEMPRREAIRRMLKGRFDNSGQLVPRYYINVRWAPWVTPEQRRAVETRYKLAEGEEHKGRTWRYAHSDPSTSNSLALIRDSAVEDTQGLDRATGALLEQPDPPEVGTGELLTGTKECATQADVKVLVQDQTDGRIILRVSAPADGLVFLSEPYYPEREAFVDGTAVESFKANLAFTAIPVPAGAHRVELRHVPGSFYFGAGVSFATLLAWVAILVRT
jgi:hypothetical protein